MLSFHVEEENLRTAHRTETLRSGVSGGVGQLPVSTGQSDQRQEFVQSVVRSLSTHRLLAGPAGPIGRGSAVTAVQMALPAVKQRWPTQLSTALTRQSLQE